MPCPFETIISLENKDKGEIFFNISFLRRLTHSALLGKGIRTPNDIPSHSLLRVIEKVQRDIVPMFLQLKILTKQIYVVGQIEHAKTVI